MGNGYLVHNRCQPQPQPGLYGIKLWHNLDSRSSPTGPRSWILFEVQSFHSILPGLFSTRWSTGSVVSPQWNETPLPAFYILLFISLGCNLHPIIKQKAWASQCLHVSPSHLSFGGGGIFGAYRHLLYKEVHFFIEELCSGVVVYTQEFSAFANSGLVSNRWGHCFPEEQQRTDVPTDIWDVYNKLA